MLEGALSLEWTCGGHQHQVDCSPVLRLTTQQGVRHELELTPSLKSSIGHLGRWSGEYVRAGLTAQPIGRIHTVRQLSIIPEDLRPTGFVRQAAFVAPQRGPLGPGTAQLGAKPYVVVLAKFADRLSEPKAKTYYDGLFSNSKPGLDHYFRNVSYDQMNLGGTVVFNWITLPKPYNDYVVAGKLDFNMVVTDAANAVDASVDFRNFYGINVMINDSIGGGIWGLGGGIYLTLDGESRVWGATLNGYSQDQFLLAHEMGHSLGFGHAGSSMDEYGSPYDPMGNGKFADATYGSVGIHYHMWHKWWAGWINNSRVYHGYPGTNRLVRIYRRSDSPPAGTLMARIFIDGYARRYYTLEAVKGSPGGYDGEAMAGYVVVSKVDEAGAWPRLITVVDTKPGSGTATDPLLVGDEYQNIVEGVRFKVVSSDATSFLLEVEVSPNVPWPHIITHTGDSGPNSLREAMVFGQEFPRYYPQFNVPNASLTNGVAVFQPASALPTIRASGFTLNGFTQMLHSGDQNTSGPEVVIDGTNAGDYVSGVHILKGSNNIIRSIGIQNFKSSGIFIEGPGNQNNVVDYCHIGVTADGTTQAGNQNEGITITRGAKATWVGGTVVRGNVISGNKYRGIGVWDAGTDNTFIFGNKVGPNRAVTASLTPEGHGISIVNGPKGTKIQNNTISGNKLQGIDLWGAGTDSTLIQGNWIGVDGTGNVGLPNATGITIQAPAEAPAAPKNTTIGGNTAALRNIISGNTGSAIWAGHVTLTGVTISGNWIGTGANGVSAVGNGGTAIVVSDGSNIKIGGITSGERNVIANNTGHGIGLWRVSIPFVQGNWIGYNANRGNAGNTSIGIYLDDCVGPRIGGTTFDQRNYIGNTGSHGIGLWNNTRDGFIQGNQIGIGTLGNSSAPITGDGIVMTNGSRNNTIGGTVLGSANVIGNTTAKGISLWNANTTNNKVYGNWVGFYSNGTPAPVAHEAVVLSNGANNNFIGGSQSTQRNVFGNAQFGVSIWTSTGNFVVGNWIGVTPNQQAQAPITGIGVYLNQNAMTNRVTDNVITKTNSEAIAINNGSSGNIIQRNLVGFRPDGVTAGEVAWRGVYIHNNSNNNQIGGSNSAFGNRFGNCATGVGIWSSTGNMVQGNTFGLNAQNAAAPFVNDAVVIGLTAADNWIGGTQPGAGNVITNGNYGVLVSGTAVRNRIRMNSIHSNRKIGINLFGADNAAGITANDNLDADSGPNDLTNFPNIHSAIPNGAFVQVVGVLNAKPNTSYVLDFYSSVDRDPSEYGEGQYYVGSVNVTTDAQGNANFNTSLVDKPGGWMSATATDGVGNTSEFSWAKSKP